MPRRKTTLSIDAELIERMKIQAIRENRDVSTITEDLYSDYLKTAETSTRTLPKKKKQ